MVDVSEVHCLVVQAADKSCSLDPAPTWIVRRYVEDLSPLITTLINASIREDHFPSSLKCAIITPILMKPSLDPNNYRPFVESIVHFEDPGAMRLCTTVCTSPGSSMLPEKQSAYRRHHSTKTAVLDVMSDVLMAADSSQVTLLG